MKYYGNYLRMPILFIVLFFSTDATSQGYFVGVSVCDTIVTNMRYDAPNCSTGSLRIRLDRRGYLTPHVTGLNFQVEITAIYGNITSNVSDTVQAGDIFSLPVASDSGFLKVFLPEGTGFFEFLVKIAGTPTVADEVYYCNIDYVMTTAVCDNELEIYAVDEQKCTVQSHPNPVKDFGELPAKYKLKPNYPNPFNPTTTIEFAISQTSDVTLKIYNLRGEEVATLVSEKLPPGNYKRVWSSEGLSSGVYFYRLQAGTFVQTRKLLLVR